MDINSELLKQASKSTAQRRKVGAVLVYKDKIIAQGYNHNSRSKKFACEDANGNSVDVIHAEIACMDKFWKKFKGKNHILKDATLYVTHAVCDKCHKELQGVKVVVVDPFHPIQETKRKGIPFAYVTKLKFPKAATAVMPKPKGAGDDITLLVGRDLEARAKLGEQKYGERLKANNGRDGLIDLYQELLDASVYIKQVLVEEGKY